MKKNLKYSLYPLLALVFTTGCVTSNHSIDTKEPSKHTTAHWGYVGEHSPVHWGDIKEEYKLCSNGKMQTPINIIATKDIDIKPIDFNYNALSKSLINNGHSIQVNIKDGSFIKIDNIEYNLKQFHFHTPSENNINSVEYPLEAHFVHKSKDGKLAVVAVMFKEGKANLILEKIWSKLPLKVDNKINFTLSSDDIKSIIPKDNQHYKFMGSLTTPPCTENVQWLVYETPLSISKEQVTKFFNIFGHTNNRPLQDVNSRVILK
jgi:carbonic anhydrase